MKKTTNPKVLLLLFSVILGFEGPMGCAPTDAENGAGSDGDADGDSDGDSDGDADGDSDGDADGDSDGDADGDSDGDADGDSDGDTDGDADGDADGDSDSDSDSNQNMCENYPDEGTDFNEGSVIQNYKLFDKDDREFELCELAANHTRLLIRLQDHF